MMLQGNIGGGRTLRTHPFRRDSLPFQLAPLCSALLLLAIHRQQVADTPDWQAFLAYLVEVTLAAIPLVAAHLLALNLPRRAALAAWLLIFVLYPVAERGLGLHVLLPPWQWLLVAVASAASLFFEQRSRTSLLALFRNVPLTLDGAIIAILAAWALAASSLFIATPNPVENQPLSVWFDAARIAGHPVLFASYILQFSTAVALVFGYFWLCRHVLVRKVLRERGWISFLGCSLVLWLLYTPIACSIVLLLPLNTADWTLLPSEVPNPFHPANYRFSAALWVLIVPIVLASERLLALADAAMSRHEQARAELQMLRQQINPHFLFNALNTIYALCLQGKAASGEAVVKLSDLLRYSVYETEADWVPLDGEIAHLRNYLDLQLLRFSANCRVDARWPEATDGLCIPPQLLIILAENMFKHGVERSSEPVTLVIDLAIDHGRIDFRCSNSPLAKGAPEASPGLGLINLRRRLELLCGDAFHLESGPDADGWTARLQLELAPC